MSGHLSDSEIAAWAVGERERASLAHVSECPSCQAAIAGLEEALVDFRVGVRKTCEAPVAGAPYAGAILKFPRLWRGLAVATTAVAAFLLAGGPGLPSRERVRRADSAADAALLQQVDREISQPVPDSMQPLLELLAADNAPVQKDETFER